MNWLIQTSEAIKRVPHTIGMMLMDMLIVGLSAWIAFSISILDAHSLDSTQYILIAFASIFAVPIFARMGVYRTFVRHFSEHALWALMRSMLAVGATWTIFAFFAGFAGDRTFPTTTPVLFVIVGFPLLVSLRYLAKLFVLYPERKKYAGKNILIYGAGSAGRQLAASLRHSRQLVPVGFVDDSVVMQGREIDGVRIYSMRSIQKLIDKYAVEDVIVSIPSLTSARRKAIINSLQELKLHVRILPQLSDIASGKNLVGLVREVEIDDLLGRDPVPMDHELISGHVTNKNILIIGAGGTIGSELARQVLGFRPKTLLLFEQSEAALYEIHRELLALACDLEELVEARKIRPVPRIIPILGSSQDPARLASLMQTWKPAIIYHAAAYKHVPMVEHNVVEGVRNNVFGPLVAARVAMQHGVSDFVFISTDKAVRPTNVMGASKRLAEMIFQALALEKQPIFNCQDAPEFSVKNDMHISFVRFGNVLGSSGSVVPLFQEQIRLGGPVTVTDPSITRYFMSISEASQLVLTAAAMASVSPSLSDRTADVFVLDMGEPVKIVDLARRMIELSGLRVDEEGHEGDIAIRFTGLRPGEKLHEELWISGDRQVTSNPRIYRAAETFLAWDQLMPLLRALQRALQEGDAKNVIKLLSEIIEDYRSPVENSDWVAQETDQLLRQ